MDVKTFTYSGEELNRFFDAAEKLSPMVDSIADAFIDRMKGSIGSKNMKKIVLLLGDNDAMTSVSTVWPAGPAVLGCICLEALSSKTEDERTQMWSEENPATVFIWNAVWDALEVKLCALKQEGLK